MSRTSTASIVLALALFLTACGSTDTSDDQSAPATDTTIDSSATPAADSAAPTSTAPASTAPASTDGCDAEPEILVTDNGVEFVRTPDSCFDDLPDWDYDAEYVEIDGLRQAYIDEGPADGQTILLLHGQPSWSYLYRDMIPTLLDAGYRVIAMDHLGMGRSDKPINEADYSVENHVERLETFVEELDIVGTDLFAQDWGSVIGLYALGGNDALFDRVVIGNGGLPDVEEASVFPDDLDASNAQFDQLFTMIPEQQPPLFDADGNPLLPVGNGGETATDGGFGQWMAYSFTSEDFQASRMLEALTYTALSPEEEAAYDAPFPSPIYMMGTRIFPSLRNELIDVTDERRDALTRYDRPFLTIFGGNDPGLAGDGDGQPWMIENIPGAEGQPHERFPDASHYLQDDRGETISQMIIDFHIANP